MKRMDIVVIACGILLALALALCGALLSGGKAASVVVTIGGEEALRAPLSVDETYTFKQEDGALNVIEIRDGAVRMTQANCRDGLCMRQGETRSAAKSIVCLPHSLVVHLEGDEAQVQDGEIDVVI